MADKLALDSGRYIQRLAGGNRRYVQRFGVITVVTAEQLTEQRQDLFDRITELQAELDVFDELAAQVAELDIIE